MVSALAGPCDAASAGAAQGAATAHPRLTLAATILGSSVAFIDGSVVNVALPALARDLSAGPAGLTWTIDAYLLPLGALTLLGGGLGDHFGRRRLFLMGLVLFTVASIVCAAAPSLVWFLAGRGFQGLGAALLMPNSLAILGGAFTGEARGRAIGTWAATGALAGASAPILGGWLLGAVGWRSIFLLNLPVAVAAYVLAWKFVAEIKDSQPAAPLDWGGAALATAGLGLVTWALTLASSAGGATILPVSAAAAGAALFIAFIWLEHARGDRAFMPLALFASSTFVGLTLLTFFLYGALGGLLVLLPFLLIQIEHWTAVAAGAALLPVPLVIGVGSRLMGRLTAKIGGRLPLAVGSAIVGCGLASYARVGAGQVNYWTDILPPTLLVALGMGASVAPLTTTVIGSVDIGHVGAASGLNSAVARIAGLVATALLGFVLAKEGSAEAFIGGFRAAALIGGGSAVIAALCALFLIKRHDSAAA
jgi:EmrB/QacA subfamily drug resistance transporter